MFGLDDALKPNIYVEIFIKYSNHFRQKIFQGVSLNFKALRCKTPCSYRPSVTQV